MKSALKIILFGFLGLSLSFCSIFGGGKSEEAPAEENKQEYEKYSSSGVYKDIEGESRGVANENYSDDDYGDLDSDDDEDENVFLASSDEGEGASEDEENNEEPAMMDQPMAAAATATEEPLPGTEPLPIENPKPVKKKKKRRRASKKIASVSKKFKNGMYRVGTNCNMRSKPTKKARNVGKVKKGKKLWMENHNRNWVKVFKKSGPVYINKRCL